MYKYISYVTTTKQIRIEEFKKPKKDTDKTLRILVDDNTETHYMNIFKELVKNGYNEKNKDVIRKTLERKYSKINEVSKKLDYLIFNYVKLTKQIVNKSPNEMMGNKPKNCIVFRYKDNKKEILDEIIKSIIEEKIQFNSQSDAEKYISKRLTKKVTKKNEIANKKKITEEEQAINTKINEIRRNLTKQFDEKRKNDKESLILYENAVYVDAGCINDKTVISICDCYEKQLLSDNFIIIGNKDLNTYFAELRALYEGLNYAINNNLKRVFCDNASVLIDIITRLKMKDKLNGVNNSISEPELELWYNLTKEKYDRFVTKNGILDHISGACNPADIGNHKKEINEIKILKEITYEEYKKILRKDINENDDTKQ